MKTFKKSILLTTLVSTLVLFGCAGGNGGTSVDTGSQSNSDTTNVTTAPTEKANTRGSQTNIDMDGFNLANLDSIVKVNRTTLTDLRAIFRKPSMMGTTEKGERIVGYTFQGTNLLYAAVESLGLHILTFGLANSTNSYTVKNAYFKLDDQDRVVEIKKNGYAFLVKLKKGRAENGGWNECEFALTDEEINSPANYTGRREVCKRYSEVMAFRHGIDQKEVDTDEKYFFCDEDCHARRGAKKAYGPFKEFVKEIEWKEGDGSRAAESQPIHNL